MKDGYETIRYNPKHLTRYIHIANPSFLPKKFILFKSEDVNEEFVPNAERCYSLDYRPINVNQICEIHIQASSQKQLEAPIRFSKQKGSLSLQTCSFVPAMYQNPRRDFKTPVMIQFKENVLDSTTLVDYTLLPHSHVILVFYFKDK
ncbi:MAG: hypothetical protein RBQ97_10500 [Acholeplasma sp.]|nr:hypothetical protein [Acholeplasma sp.]